MKLTEAKIREAQAVFQAVMEATKSEEILIVIDGNGGFEVSITDETGYDSVSDSLAALYINRLHELAGTEPPPF